MKKQIIKNFRLDYSEYTGLDCTAPCSLCSVLLEHSLIKDPYYGENASLLCGLPETTAVFYTTFHLSNEEYIQSNILLRFHGLDTLCRIVLNGEELGKTDNIHRTYTFDVKGMVNYGENTLRLEFSPTTPFVRGAQFKRSSEFFPAELDMGIFRDIELISFSHKIIDEIVVRQVHNEDGSVRVNLEMTTLGLDTMSRAVANLVSPGGESYYCGLIGGKGSILLKNPNLWWPNGLGVQNLYRLSVNLYSDSELEDSRDIRIGLRTLALSKGGNAEGEREEPALVVNGVKFFTMGARYTTEDYILSRASKEHTRTILQGCKLAHFNSISVCGGGVYPPDYFYDLCDEMGLVVWQDVMYASLSDNIECYIDSTKAELTDNLSRIAHHPSLGVVMGNSELMECASIGENTATYSENDNPTDTEHLTSSIVKAILPDTVYLNSIEARWRNSAGLLQDNESALSQYISLDSEPLIPEYAYISEVGVESLPAYKSVSNFAGEGDLNLFSPTMEAHQSSEDSYQRMLSSLARQYRYACDFDSLIYATQLVSADIIRTNVEYARSHRGEYMGYMFGQLNDSFPCASCSSIDYYGRWKALHYYAKRFFAPVLVSASNDGARVKFTLSSEQRIVYNGRFSYELLDNKNNRIFADAFDISMDACSTLELPVVDFSDKLKGHEREYYLAYSIVGNTASSFGTILFVPPKSFDFLPPKIDREIDGNLRDYTITLTSDVYAHGVELDFTEVDAIFEDNYFDLTSGSAHRIHFTTREVTTPEALRRQIRIKTVYDIGR